MSIYRCAICDEYKDADEHGCFEYKKDDCECVCDDCDTEYQQDEEDNNDIEEELELMDECSCSNVCENCLDIEPRSFL